METMVTPKAVEEYSIRHEMTIADVWLKMSNAYFDMDMFEESDTCYLNYLDTK